MDNVQDAVKKKKKEKGFDAFKKIPNRRQWNLAFVQNKGEAFRNRISFMLVQGIDSAHSVLCCVFFLYRLPTVRLAQCCMSAWQITAPNSAPSPENIHWLQGNIIVPS